MQARPSGLPIRWRCTASSLAIAVTLANEGRLRVPVTAAFPFAEAAAAHELSETRHARGKIVLVN
jgi:NADPH:quinone reductase-like Zn-dependent oxidoreductase